MCGQQLALAFDLQPVQKQVPCVAQQLLVRQFRPRLGSQFRLQRFSAYFSVSETSALRSLAVLLAITG